MDAEKPYADVGERIKEACKQRGFEKVDQLRDAMRIAPGGELVAMSTISRWLNGRALPTKHMDLLSRVLGVSAHVLRWGETGEPVARPSQDAVAAALALLKQSGYEVREKKVSATSEVREVAGRPAQLQHPKGSARRRR